MEGHHALMLFRINGEVIRNKLTIGDDLSLKLETSRQGVLGDYILLYYNDRTEKVNASDKITERNNRRTFQLETRIIFLSTQ